MDTSRIDTDKERIRELKDKSEDITQDTAKKGKAKNGKQDVKEVPKKKNRYVIKAVFREKG